MTDTAIRPERVCSMPYCKEELPNDQTRGMYSGYRNNGYFCQEHWNMLPIYLKTAISRAVRDNNISDVVYFIGESITYIDKALPYMGNKQ